MGNPPAAPTNLSATVQSGPQVSLTFRDNASNESGFAIWRAAGGSPVFVQVGTAPARNGTGNVTFVDSTVLSGSYSYKVTAVNVVGPSAFSNTVTVSTVTPLAPTSFTATTANGNGNNRTVILNWTADTTNVTGFTIQRATNAAFTSGLNTATVANPATVTLTQTGLSRNTTYYYRIRSNNGALSSGWSNLAPPSITTNP